MSDLQRRAVQGVLFVGLLGAPGLGAPVNVSLPASGHEMIFDAQHDRLYVSMPAIGQVAVISVPEYEIESLLSVGPAPQGIDLSPDGGTLYVALNGTGGFASLDLATGEREFFAGVPLMGNSASYDVVESGGRVFLTAAPGSGGTANVVMFEFGGGGYTVTAVMGARCSPTFFEDRQGRYLYVGECFSPNSLYKIDLDLSPPARVLQDSHGTVSGTLTSSVSPDGSYVCIGSGQVLRSGSFTEEARVTAGVPEFGETSDRVYYASSGGVIRTWDMETFEQIGESIIVGGGNVTDFLVLPGEGRFLVLSGGALLGVDPEASCVGSPPLALTSPHPADGSIGVELETTLRWASASAGCPTRYDVYLTGPDGEEGLVCSSLSQRTCIPPEVLEPGALYAWRVVAENEFGVSEGPTWYFEASICPPAEPTEVRTILGGPVQEFVADPERGVAYASLPSAGEVVVLSLSTGEILYHIDIDGLPRGIAVSPDGNRLSVALGGEGAVELVSLESRSPVRERLDLSALLRDDRTWDVIEPRPGILFVSSNPGSNGFAHIVRVDLSDGSAQRVANERIIRAAPVFGTDGAADYLYIGEGFSPNSLYKLDLSQPTAPIVLEDRHGTIGGTSRVIVSPDGSRVYLTGGQVVDTSTMYPIGRVNGSAHGFDGAGRVYSASSDFVFVHDPETYSVLETIPVDYERLTPTWMHVGADGTRMTVASDLAFSSIPTQIVDCNANDLPDDCEIEQGSASDVNDDAVPDECQCGPVSEQGLGVCAVRVRCSPFGPGDAAIDLAIRNGSSLTGRYVLVVPPPGVVVEPSVVYLAGPVGPDETAPLQSLVLSAPPRTEACIGLVLLTPDRAICGSTTFCVEAPECCADVEVASVTASTDGSADLSVDLLIRNQTASPFAHVFAFNPALWFEVEPDSMALMPPLSPLESTTMTVRIPGAAGVDGLTLRVATLGADLVSGCDAYVTIPDVDAACPGDVNFDRRTDVRDFGMLATHFGESVPPGALGDCNANGTVDVVDFGVLASWFGCE